MTSYEPPIDGEVAPAGHAGAFPSPHLGNDATGARVAELFVFNTDVRLYAYPPDGASLLDFSVRGVLDAALEDAAARCWYFERTLSRTRPDSDIARAHAAAPQPVYGVYLEYGVIDDYTAHDDYSDHGHGIDAASA